MDALERRLARVESSLFRWKLTATASLLASLLLVCLGLAPAAVDAEFGNVTVRSLVVKDGQTESYIVLRCAPKIGAGIEMKSQTGKSLVQIDANESGNSPPSAWVIASTSERFAGPQNKGAIYVGDKGGRLELFRSDGENRTKTFEAPPPRPE